MSVFYLLPPRNDLARQWAKYFRQWFPGLCEPGPELADLVAEVMAPQPGVYVVFADDLPDDGHVWAALADAVAAAARPPRRSNRRRTLRTAGWTRPRSKSRRQRAAGAAAQHRPRQKTRAVNPKSWTRPPATPSNLMTPTLRRPTSRRRPYPR